jgi:hypothetical protein
LTSDLEHVVATLLLRCTQWYIKLSVSGPCCDQPGRVPRGKTGSRDGMPFHTTRPEKVTSARL